MKKKCNSVVVEFAFEGFEIKSHFDNLSYWFGGTIYLY